MPSGTLGSMSIDVMANIANLVSDLGRAQAENTKAAKEFQHQWQESIDSVHESFKGLAEIVGVGLSVDWLKEVAAQAFEGAEKIDHLSQSLGISQQSLQVMSYAAGLVGGNLDTASQALARMERAAEQATAGNEQQVEAFRALGISAAQLPQLLQSPDEFLQTIAEHVSQAGDGFGKTAAVMQIFGRGAAQIIPFLNELGSNFEELKQRAIDFGVVLTSQDQSALLTTQENINVLKEAGEGLANQFAVALAPAVNAVVESLTDLAASGSTKSFFSQLGSDVSQVVALFGEAERAIGDWVDEFQSLTGTSRAATTSLKNDVVGYVQQSLDEAAHIVNAFEHGWIDIKAGFQIMWTYIENTFAEGVAELEKELATLSDAAALIAKATNNTGLGLQMEAYSAALKAAGTNVKSFTDDLDGLAAEGNKADAAMKASIASNAEWATGIRLTASAFGTLSSGLDNFDKSLVKGDAAGNMAKLAAAQQQVQMSGLALIEQGANYQKVDADTTQVIDAMTTAVERADRGNTTYNAHVQDGTKAANEALQAQMKLGDFISKYSQDFGPLQKEQADYNAALDQLIDISAKLNDGDKLTEQNLELLDKAQVLLNQHHHEAVAIIDALNQVRQQEGDQVQQLLNGYRQEEDALSQSAAEHERVNAELAAEKQVREAVTAAIKAGHTEYAAELEDLIAQAKGHADFMVTLKQEQDLLKSWATTAQQDFDTAFQDINKDIVEGGDVMKDLTNVAKQVVEQIIFEFEKLAIINPLLQQIFGASAGNLPTLGTGQGAMNLLNGNSGIGNWLGSLFGGGDAAAAASAGQSVGIFSDLGAGANSFTETGFTTDWGAAGSAFTDGMEAGMPNIGESLGTTAGNSWLSSVTPYLAIGGGILSGINEFQNAGGGVNGLAGGLAYGAGTAYLGIGASAALSGGLSAGLAAIPVVGWVAIGAMVLDKLTGGDVFGTAYKPTGTTGTAIDIDGSGSASISDWYQEHKHGALFSSGKYKNVSMDPTADQTNALDQAMDQIQKSLDAEAKALGESAGEAISGSWSQATDKAGKVISQTSTVLGQQYTEDSQHFLERIQADSEQALLPTSTALTAFFDQFESNADTLMDATSMAIAAQIDIKNGMGLLGSTDTDLADIANEVQSLNVSGETLVQTYARLQAEQMDLSTALDEMGLSIGKTGADFVTFADQLSTAAGGIQNLNSELSALYSAYTPGGQQGINAFDNAKSVSQNALSAIGEDPNESMAQFWADFQKAMPNLTPDQMQQWITAGIDLAAFTSNVTAAAQKYADFEIASYGDSFVSAMANVVEWEGQQIDAANQLAIASGHAGASQQDLANIMRAGSAQMGKAMADLTSGITQDISALNGAIAGPGANTTIGLLNAISGGVGGNNFAQQQAHAQQVSTTYDLIQKLGDFDFGTGKSVDQVLQTFGLNPGQLGRLIGENADQVRDQIQAAADQDKAMVNLVNLTQETNDILRDQLDVLQGKDPSVDLSKYLSTSKGDDSDPSTKPSVGTGTLPPGTYPSSTVTAGDRYVAAAMDRNTTATRESAAAMRNANRYRPTQRNTRSIA